MNDCGLAPGTWRRIGNKFLVRPPEGGAIFACPMRQTVVVHADGTITVLPFLRDGLASWRVERSRFSRVT